MTKFPVIIVGGGPVGLTMALELAKQGISSVVIEKHPGTTNHPKARGVNCRSMEIFRQLYVSDKLTQYKMPAEAHRFIWLEDFQGKEITRVEQNVDYSRFSPTDRAVISQDCVEYELFLKANANDLVELRFNHRMIHAEQNDSHVQLDLIDEYNNSSYQLSADYLVAADGAYSSLRDIFNVNMEGVDNLGEFCNIYCEMNLDKYVAHRPSVGFMFIREDLLGAFMLAKAGLKRWLVGVRLHEDLGQSKDTFTDQYCIDYVKQVVSDDSVEVKLINKGFWTMAALIAETYQVGRVFFAGDAAHRLPPTGGFGMNTGIQDAHNLAWKLAFVLKGYADDSLLKTYETERQPIAATNIQWSNKNAQRFTTIYTALAEKDLKTFRNALADQTHHLNNINLDLGFIYGQDYTSNEEFQQLAIVGGRAPHCWLKKADVRLSTLDLFVDKFIVLCHPQATYWQNYFKEQSIPCEIITIGKGGNLRDDDDDFLEIYNLSHSGAVLVRPDGHIAWMARDDKAVFDYEISP